MTFTVSSLNTSSSGAGRKSGTTFNGPMGPSVYLIFALINLFTFAPVAGPEYPDSTIAVCESDSQNSAPDLPETVIPLFTMTMGQVFSNDATRVGVGESSLRFRERNAMLGLVDKVLLRVLFKAFRAHV